MNIVEALESTEPISEMAESAIKSLAYAIKYYQFDHRPTETERERMAQLRARLEQIEAEKKAQRKARRQRATLTKCDCGHESQFPMATANGTACGRCYDRMSD